MSDEGIIESVQTPTGLSAGNVNFDPPGDLVGGALIPGEMCLCNCGRRASLNLGGISWSIEPNDSELDPITGLHSHVDYWSFLDGGGVLPVVDSNFSSWTEGTLGSRQYVAYMDFSDVDEDCLPQIVVLFGFDSGDATSGEYLSPGRMTVSVEGEGRMQVIEQNGDAGSPNFGELGLSLFVDRPGVKYGNATGVYRRTEDTYAFVSAQSETEWRRP
jgi:hypothetical protein